MEEIINHFLYYSEGPVLPSGFSQGSVEAPKGHLGVSIVSNGGNKGSRIRIRSSIQVMAGQITSLVQGVTLGDFVVIVSGSNIVVGEIDR
jgi:NADH-quinone oxidoreductase subunit D